jgi:NADPH:quinone reductase-like Zn-dependent oxidoreductase
MRTLAQPTWNPTDALVPVELPTPEPQPDEVRVAVKAIGVNPVDWKMRQKGPLRLAARVLGPPLPFVPGVDFAGVVDAVGARVTSLKPGDRVVGGTDFSRGQRGSYADTVIARPDQVTVLPDPVDFETAGALPVAGVTAAMAVLEFGRLEAVPADARRVLVLGASGGVGQLAVQIARNAGAQVVGVCSARNVERVRALGATRVIDYGAAGIDPLTAAAESGPYRVIVDCVGGYPAGGCRRLLGPGGRHVMVAGDSAGAFFQALVPPFSSRILLGKPTGARLAPLVQAIAEGRLHVEIAQRFPLAEAEAAHALSQSGRVVGKIVLVV